MRTLRDRYQQFSSASLLQWDPSQLWRTFASWDICLFHPADRYSHSDASKPTPSDSPRPAGSNALCTDAVRPLAEWLCILLYLSSPCKYFPIHSYCVLQACAYFGAYTIQFPSPSGLQRDPSWLWWTSTRWGISLFLPADIYSHAHSSKHTLLDSPLPADSNPPCPDAVWPMVEGLSKHSYLSSPGQSFQIVGYWVLQACGDFETYTIQFPSASGIQRTLSRRCLMTGWSVIYSFVL